MQRQICILGCDPRQRWVARYLSDSHQTVTYGVWETEDSGESLCALLPQVQALALPMPAVKNGQILLSGNRTVPPEDVIGLLPADAVVFGGMLPPCDYGGRKTYDYTADETVVACNGAITAEAALCLAMEQLPTTLWRSRCLVIGFGRIGKLLALRLRGMGAYVAVSARSPGDLAAIAVLGYDPVQTGCRETELSQYTCIFNTVPAPVLPMDLLRRTAEDCLLIDLASMPGGIDAAACAKLNRRLIHALSLPGKNAPAAAGRILAEHILSHL